MADFGTHDPNATVQFGYPSNASAQAEPSAYPASVFPTPAYPTPAYPASAYAAPARPRFSDISGNWGWAVVSVIFFWPLGIAAVVSAGRVVPAMLDGDYQRAQNESRRARKFGIISLCIAIVLVLLYFVVVLALIAAAVHDCNASTDC